MKATGIVRKIDDLGRVVLPKELRKTLDLNLRDSLEIFVDEECIVLRKYESADIFTGETENLIVYKGKKVSEKSVREMARIAGLKVF